MRIVSKFAETGELYFEADDRSLADSGVELIERVKEGDYGTSKIKAFLLEGILLHYTYNVFQIPLEFVVLFSGHTVVNTFHLRSEEGISSSKYEPYLLCDEEFSTNQYAVRGKVKFRTPLITELFRLFISPAMYREILQDYGKTFSGLVRTVRGSEPAMIFPSPLPVSPQMKIIIREIVAYPNPHKDLVRNFCRTKTLELIHLQLEQVLAQGEDSKKSRLNAQDVQKIHEAGKILRVNFNRPPSVRQLSAMLATNENKLKQGFHQIYNTSLYQYVISLRVEKAIELMRDGTNSIQEIADAVGYANVAHFTRAFKKTKGVSPGSFRNSILT